VVVSGGPIEDEHAAGAANRRWGLGNQLFGEVEIEIGYAQIGQILMVICGVLDGKSW
jgi:hypothetical protein